MGGAREEGCWVGVVFEGRGGAWRWARFRVRAFGRSPQVKKMGAGRPARAGGSSTGPAIRTVLYGCTYLFWGRREPDNLLLLRPPVLLPQFRPEPARRRRHQGLCRARPGLPAVGGHAVRDAAGLDLQDPSRLGGMVLGTGKGAKGGRAGNPGKGLLSLQRLCPCCPHRHRCAGA